MALKTLGIPEDLATVLLNLGLNKLDFPVWKLQKRRDGYSVNIFWRNTEGSATARLGVRDFEIHWISSGFRISEWISGFLDFKVDFWISKWISGFQSGFLDFKVDFSRDLWISSEFLDFKADFWISKWISREISGFQADFWISKWISRGISGFQADFWISIEPLLF